MSGTFFGLSEEEVTTFMTEAEEELDRAEQVLLEMEASKGQFGRRDDDPEKLDLLFRAMHTLKGNASSIGFTSVAQLVHHAEDLMEGVRDGRIAPSAEVADLLLGVVDSMRTQLMAVSGDEAPPEVPRELWERLAEWLRTEGVKRDDECALQGNLASDDAIMETTSFENAVTLRIEISPDADIPAVRGLQALIACEEKCAELRSRPAGEDLENGALEAGGTLHCQLKGVEDLDALVKQLEVLTGVTQVVCDQPGGKGNGLISRENKNGGSFRISESSRQIRVDVAVMDRLMNQVVEMVITRNRLSSLINGLKHRGHSQHADDMAATVEQMATITTNMQEDIMKTRLVPLDTLFRRFPRMLRNLNKESDKSFTFDVAGGETEIDRSLLDAISDPLIHLLRNAVDHGIEPPNERKEKNKSSEGRIALSAANQENYVVVEVRDDGAGISPERVLEKAREKGVLGEQDGQNMTDEEILDLLFHPGFSTSDEVTEISGRGVGLDVVRRDIEAVNGTVSIESQLDQGSVFRLLLPLTVTTVRSLLVQIAEQVYAIPLGSIRETMQRGTRDLHQVGEQAMLPFRGQFIPLFRLVDFFPDCDHVQSDGKEEYIVIMSLDRREYGLMVDDLLGDEESVIKPLKAPLNAIPGLSSATIRPDGRVALILDANGLFKEMRKTVRRVSSG